MQLKTLVRVFVDLNDSIQKDKCRVILLNISRGFVQMASQEIIVNSYYQ